MGPAKLLTAMTLSTLFVTATQAGIVVEVTQPAVLPGYTAYGIYWDGGGTTDWTSAGLLVDLSQGTFYQDTLGGNGAPTSAFFPIVPTLEFDTYVGIIGDSTGGLAGCCGDLGGGDLVIIPGRLQVSWYNTRTDDTGYVKIGNFTVPDDALGTWRILSDGVIYEGIIPEPATLALFGFALPGLLRRR